MPSFCWPFGRGPNPAITLPCTGQRKVGAAVDAPLVETGAGSAAGVATATDSTAAVGLAAACLGLDFVVGDVTAADGFTSLVSVAVSLAVSLGGSFGASL